MALTFNDDQGAALLESLGLPTDTADTDTILATVKDAVTATPVVDARPSAIAAAAKRAGLEVLDADTAELVGATRGETFPPRAAPHLRVS